MNNYEKLKKVKKRIYKLVPELKRKENGCKVLVKGEYGDYETEIYNNISGEDYIYDTTGYYLKIKKVIGKPITIKDVLLALSRGVQKPYEFAVTRLGYFLEWNRKEKRYDNLDMCWNLNDDILENQREYIIDFLYRKLYPIKSKRENNEKIL